MWMHFESFSLFPPATALSSFILERNMHFVVANIVKPLTQSKGVSFVSLWGGRQVDYFVSHSWGTSFPHFVQSIQRLLQWGNSLDTDIDNCSTLGCGISPLVIVTIALLHRAFCSGANPFTLVSILTQLTFCGPKHRAFCSGANHLTLVSTLTQLTFCGGVVSFFNFTIGSCLLRYCFQLQWLLLAFLALELVRLRFTSSSLVFWISSAVEWTIHPVLATLAIFLRPQHRAFCSGAFPWTLISFSTLKYLAFCGGALVICGQYLGNSHFSQLLLLAELALERLAISDIFTFHFILKVWWIAIQVIGTLLGISLGVLLQSLIFRKPGPKSRTIQLRQVPLLGLLLFLQMIAGCRGEGCTLAMQGAEVSPSLDTHWLRGSDTKPHGMRPPRCSGTQTRLAALDLTSKVKKRSLLRAYRRAQNQGYSWYRRQYLSVNDYEAMGCQLPTPAPVPSPSRDWQLCSQHHSPKRRLIAWQWNCGGITAARLDEVCAWLFINKVDVAVLVETRWQFTATWSDKDWHFIHSGEGPGKCKGLLILISTTLCSHGAIQWQCHDSGRLLHARIMLSPRPLDVIACYQHVFQPNPDCQRLRDRWWTLLEHVLHGLPHRNSALVLGDFNFCGLTELAGSVGTSHFRWGDALIAGKVHPDHSRFQRILRMHSLVVLNSWSSALGPTYVHGQQASRLDWFCVRHHMADGQSRHVQYLWDSPFLLQTEYGHVPMLCTLAKYWIPQNGTRRIQQVTMQQRQTGRQAYLHQTDTWHQCIQQVQSDIAHCLASPTSSMDATMTVMHEKVLQSFCSSFPPGKAVRQSPAWHPASEMILNKWDHRRQMLKPAVGTLRNVFHCWYHVCRFLNLKRQHKRFAYEVCQTRFHEVVTQAAHAASRHDTHRLFHIINAYAPKVQRRQIQLRNEHGHMANPMECAAILNKFVADTWKGPARFNISFADPPGVPFSVSQLENALALIPSTKAVAKPFAPGIVWRQIAPFLAPLLHARLSEWWSYNPPYIPRVWKQGWLFLIAKPLKPATCPANLRPLALQEPVGKSILGLIIQQAMTEALLGLIHLPLWAYLANRSTADALRIVTVHCQQVKRLLSEQRSTPHSRASCAPRLRLYGGLQLCLDLQRAFDCVNRVKLFQKLHLLNISAPLISLLTTWHEDAAYIVQTDSDAEPIQIGRGVRQGCKAAPGLWSFFLVIFLSELSTKIPLTWIQQCMTIYADDFHVGMIFRSMEEFQFALFALGQMFAMLHQMELQVNPHKSVSILEMRGSAAARMRRRCIIGLGSEQKMVIAVPDLPPLHIPLKTQTKYLGIVISYGAFEMASLRHRLSLMKIGFQRLRRWLTCKHGLTLQQKFHLWQTCIYPIFSYGVFVIGLPVQGIRIAITQLTTMIRQIAHDHPWLTRRTHAQAFQHHHIPAPIQLLRRSAAGLLRTVQDRSSTLMSHDLALQVDWTHLPSLLHQLDHWQANSSLETLLSSTGEAWVRTPFFQCALCDFCTTDVSSFRRHCTISHKAHMHRTQMVTFSDHAVGGLPQCKTCGTVFSTWRVFQAHLERGCQELLPGPLRCSQPEGPLGSALGSISLNMARSPDDASRGQRVLTETELDYLRQLDFGDRLIDIVKSRNWRTLEQERNACKHLATQCILCAVHFSRTQELHHHYKLHHPDLWEHAPQKALQLSNINCLERPCVYCGALFKNHTCPVWSQIAVLLVNGAGLASVDAEPLSSERRTCDLCQLCFSSVADLTQHLQSEHGLQGLSFVEGRDALDNTSVCSHCGQIFQTMSGLKTHIVQGRCSFFNPASSSETKVVEDRWKSACVDGTMLDIFASPMARLHLTVTCQQCGKGCQRAADLVLHLQTSHARLWRDSQRLTMTMLEKFSSQNECHCNPQTGSKRGYHVCPAFRQLAMCHLRLDLEPSMPIQVTDHMLFELKTPRVESALRFRLEQFLAGRQFSKLWQDSEILQLLRTQCICCGKRCGAADLALHLREDHAFLIQSALVLSALLNGGAFPFGTAGLDGVLTSSGGVSVHGPSVPGPRIAPGAQSAAAQAPTQRRPKQARRSRRSGDGEKPLSSNHATGTAPSEDFDSSCHQARPGDSKYPQDGSIHSFLNRAPEGALQLLLTETVQWKKDMEDALKSKTMLSLRQHLMLTLLKALRARMDQLIAAQDTEALYTTSVQKGLILADRSFPFHRWDSASRQLVLDKKAPISAKKMAQHLDELQEMMLDRELVVRFHALRPPSTQGDAPIPWRLQVHMRADRPYELLFQMAHNSIWMLLGASMKPHTMGQSSMATQLMSMLQTTSNKGRGKGKTKSKSKPQHSKKELET
eukprot:s1036_g2.t1